MNQLQNQQSVKKSNKKFIIAIIIAVVTILGWAGLTKAGYIPNYLNVTILCPNQNNEPAPTNDPRLVPIDKPVIYLYPTQKQDVSVRLDYVGKIFADYPEYNNSIGGWNVTAYPDGHLINKADNEEYSYLFWEGMPSSVTNWNISEGFIVEGKDTREFLQNTLAKMGLTPKEYNEFIVYWYPIMKDNKYNLITFADKQYTETAPLTITPKPDSILRVFMVFKPLNNVINIKPQTIKTFERKGFSVIEWGGTEIK